MERQEGNGVPAGTIIDVKVLSTFKQEATHISGVDSTKAWVCEISDSKLMLVSHDGHVIKTEETGCEIFDIEATSSGDVLITEDDGKAVQKMKDGGGPLTKIIDTGPDSTLKLYTYGVSTTKNGDILVALFRKGESKVIRFSDKGDILQVIEYLADGKTRLFSHPMALAENINGDICVLDCFYRIVVVDNTGALRFKYNGTNDQPLENKFAPCYIQTDRYGHIIISDHDNSAVHLLDKDGHFIQYLLTSNDGLCKPRGLSVDLDGNLWICHGEEDNRHVMIIRYLQS